VDQRHQRAEHRDELAPAVVPAVRRAKALSCRFAKAALLAEHHQCLCVRAVTVVHLRDVQALGNATWAMRWIAAAWVEK